MIEKEKIVNGYLISTDKSLLDIHYVHNFLSQNAYWSKGVPKSIVEKSIENSLTFGIYKERRQLGFARVVTDYATFGYLADVFIDESKRGEGLSKILLEFIFEIEDLKCFRRIILGTRDAHGLYQKFGFAALKNPAAFMEIHQPEVYTKLINN